jgi:prophage regulatory protein
MIKPAYLDFSGVTGFVALSGSTVQQLVRDGTFPKPRLLSGRRVAWLVRELEDWAELRPVSDQLPPQQTNARKPRAVQPLESAQ